MLSIVQKDNSELSLAEGTSLDTEDGGASEEIESEEHSEEPTKEKVMEGQVIKQRKKKAKTLADTDIDIALIKALERSALTCELPLDEDECYF